MNLKEKGRGMGTVVVICALVAVAGGFWIYSEFENPVSPAQPDASIRLGDSPDAVTLSNATPVTDSGPEQEAQLGTLMGQQNRIADAKIHYRKAVVLYHEQVQRKDASPEQLNNLAWLLASSPYPEIRNGKEAVELAQRACELTQWHQAVVVGTLAAAYAEAGRFDDAAKTAQRAKAIALANGEEDVAAKNEKLLKLYQVKLAYREAF